MKSSILLVWLPVLFFSCDDRFDFIPPRSCEIHQVKIISAPNVRIDGRLWDEDLMPEYCYIILNNVSRVATSDTSQVVSCNPMLLPLSLKNENSHVAVNDHYKLIILDKDDSGQSEVMASIEFSPGDLYKKNKPDYNLSNEYLDIIVSIKWNEDDR